MVSTNSLKNGMTLLVDNKLAQVVEFQHVKPGKGPAFVRTKLKFIESNKLVDKTFRAAEDIPAAVVERKDLQFLYREGTDFVFMDADTYDQQNVTAEAIGDNANWLLEGDTINVMFYEGRIIGVDIPANVELLVTQTEPGFAGNTATGATKPATLETGVEVQVPLFITEGEKIKVDTRSGDYLSRA